MADSRIDALIDPEARQPEVEACVPCGRQERTDECTTYRNGRRQRDWSTRLGTVRL